MIYDVTNRGTSVLLKCIFSLVLVSVKLRWEGGGAQQCAPHVWVSIETLKDKHTFGHTLLLETHSNTPLLYSLTLSWSGIMCMTLIWEQVAILSKYAVCICIFYILNCWIGGEDTQFGLTTWPVVQHEKAPVWVCLSLRSKAISALSKDWFLLAEST